MRKDDVIRLQHMLDAAQEAIEFSKGRSVFDLNVDRKLVLALVKAVEIIGEAAYQISQTTRDQLSNIPWDDIIGMRHRLVHAYFGTDAKIVWETATALIPTLKPQVMQVLDTESQNASDD